jgi:hypothetical protein
MLNQNHAHAPAMATVAATVVVIAAAIEAVTVAATVVKNSGLQFNHCFK